MPNEDELPWQPDIAAMLTDQTSACKPAREAIAAGAEVQLSDGEAPFWMVFGIVATRLRRSLARNVQVTIGLDETVEILARHRGENFRNGTILSADRLWFFNLYFDATGAKLLACSGVERPRRPSTKDSFEP
ncbi:hypothetical protein [Streptomyces sp. NPDC057301]|uniref:hypothetical protein n=1 Tax=Streptomyces sp. NPDC057301 TaxID=3346093 RepID=UPI00362AAE6E